MGRWCLAAWLLAVSGCGAGEAGFRIDQVSLSPDDIPVNTTSDETLTLRASVFNDRHEVYEVLARSDEAAIWIELLPGGYPRWSASVPASYFFGFQIGDYWLDLEARDLADRRIVLEDAVRLEIRDD